jgi:hypothetical protein
MRYELMARYDARASFYGKAIIEANNGTITLLSYNTEVARITDNGVFEINSNISRDLLYSNTTLRHIKEFYKQFVATRNLTKSDLYAFETRF